MPDSRDHFAAYSFVDRIVEFEPGKHARATFAVPRDDRRVSRRASSPRRSASSPRGSRWSSIDFRGRPGGGARHRDALPRRRGAGRHARARVDILECDDDAVAYNGRATRRRRVIELVDCLGPMLPVARFDAPEALRERLRAAARRRRAAGSLPRRRTDAGRRDAARCRAPAARDASTCRRRAVLRRSFPAPAGVPGDAAARHADAPRARPRARIAGARHARRGRSRVTHVKMRSFIAPAQRSTSASTLAPAQRRRSRRRCCRRRPTTASVASARLELDVRDADPDEAATTRRDHRHRPRHARRQRRRDDVGALLDGAQSGGGADHAVRRRGFPTRIAAEVKGFDARVITAPRKLAEVREPLAPLRARGRRAGDARRGHRADGRGRRRAGAARSAPA